MNYFTGERTKISMVLVWIGSNITNIRIDTKVYNPYSIKHATVTGLIKSGVFADDGESSQI
jgi:hypothetical protein